MSDSQSVQFPQGQMFTDLCMLLLLRYPDSADAPLLVKDYINMVHPLRPIDPWTRQGFPPHQPPLWFLRMLNPEQRNAVKAANLAAQRLDLDPRVTSSPTEAS